MLTIAFVRDLVRMAQRPRSHLVPNRAASQELLHQILLRMEVRAFQQACW